QQADLVIGTDPDADRMGIAVRGPDGRFVLCTGNQTAALLTWYICEQHRRRGDFPPNGVVVSTIVTSDMMKDIARSYGAEVIETLTGFKWIAAAISEFEKGARLAASGGERAAGTGTRSPSLAAKRYLFGAE